MKGGVGATLVHRYARSLFGAARDGQLLGPVRKDLAALHDLWLEQGELKALLMNPGLSRKKVRAILEALATRMEVCDMTRAFIALLLEKDRLEILADTQPEFEKLVREYEGKIEVRVTTAVPADESLQRHIMAHLKEKSGKDPIVQWHQDSGILGGLVIEWPDRVFDGSLARKVDNMKERLAGQV
jgi:F-type H+-transporting ATPase subunit delta